MASLDDLLQRARAFQDSVAKPHEPAARELSLADEQIIAKLDSLDTKLATSYSQALLDLADPNRLTFMGPAGEIREVMRVVVHKLAPDDKVKAEPWFTGDDDGKPTQAERIRYAAQGSGTWETARDSAETIEQRVGALGRRLYGRASKAFHSGTERKEVNAILGYVRAVLADILP